MKLVVDLTRCQGYGQCAFLAPQVFRMRGGEALMDNPEPDDGQREPVLRAAAACPVQAIRLERIGSGEMTTTASAPRSTAAIPAQRSAREMVSAALEVFRRTGRIVIVGASLAGMTAAAVRSTYLSAACSAARARGPQFGRSTWSSRFRTIGTTTCCVGWTTSGGRARTPIPGWPRP